MKIKDELLKDLIKPISLWDKIKATIWKYPALYDHSQFYDEWLEDFLDQGVEILEVTLVSMTLRNTKGVVEKFDTVQGCSKYGAKYWGSYAPTRKLQLRLRELQLTKREELIEIYKKRVLEDD